MRKMLRIVRKILFWIFFVGLFLLTTVVVILNIYEDDIKQYALNELNQRLNQKVEVEEIQLSILHDFPSASIEFSKVFIADAFPDIESDDTLFYAQKMFFNFDVMDLYSGNYEVKRIALHEGCLNMKTAESGTNNYDILRKDSTKSREDEFELLLDLIEVEDFSYSYQNYASSQLYDFTIHEGLISGDFSSESYELKSSADLKINTLKSNAFTLISDKEADLDIEMLIQSKQKRYEFKQGDLTIEEMPFGVSGFFDSSFIDLQIVGKEMSIDDLANSLIDTTVSDVQQYEGHGNIEFLADIEGSLKATELPSVKASFKVSEASLIEPSSKAQLENISFEGEYQNAYEGRQEMLGLHQVSLSLLSGYLQGEAKVTNFERPLIDAKVAGDLNLGSLQQFFKFDKVEKLTGNTIFDLDLAIRLLDPLVHKEKFKVNKSNGSLSLKKVGFKQTDALGYNNINGDIILKNKDAATKNLTVQTAQSDIQLNGAIKNLVPFLEGTGSLGLIASIESNYILLDEFLSSSSPQENEQLEMFTLPDNINLNIDVHTNKMKWKDHVFTDVRSKVLMGGRKVKLKRMSGQTNGGFVAGHITLSNNLEDGNLIEGKIDFNNINVKQLFAEWNNFDQQSITSKHISGSCKGSIDLLLPFNPYFSLVEDKLYAKCKVKISQGELKNLETMKMITEYMRGNKGLNLLLKNHIDNFEQKLLHLKFDDLENEITIKNSRVEIPKMKIESNALDVGLFGWHTFDNQIEYHFNFRFRELKQKPSETEFGVIEDDGLGLLVYLSMFGDLLDPEFKLDKEERKKDLKADLAEEKEDIKSILKSEFGFFKKDSTVHKMKEDNKKEAAYIYLEEDDQDTTDSTSTEPINKKRSLKLFEKLKLEQEKQKQKDKIDIQNEQ